MHSCISGLNIFLYINQPTKWGLFLQHSKWLTFPKGGLRLRTIFNGGYIQKNIFKNKNRQWNIEKGHQWNISKGYYFIEAVKKVIEWLARWEPSVEHIKVRQYMWSVIQSWAPYLQRWASSVKHLLWCERSVKHLQSWAPSVNFTNDFTKVGIVSETFLQVCTVRETFSPSLNPLKGVNR